MQIPKHIFLDMNISCNLKCIQCDIYKLQNPSNEISAEERKGIIKQIAEWDKSIRLVLTGGEQFLRRTQLFEITETCKKYGVYTTISSNGTMVKEEEYRYLPYSGINCIVFSIDSHKPEIHDKIRGVKGTFSKVEKSIKQSVKERDKAKTDFTVLTSTIIGSHNLDFVPEMVDFLETLGVDTTLYQPIQPNFASDKVLNKNWFLENELFPKRHEQVNKGIDDFIRLKERGKRLYQKIYQFEDMRYYFFNPNNLKLGMCASMNENLMIDMLGNVRLCFNMERIGLKPVGNIKTHTLRSLWETTLEIKKVMKNCTQGCGSMICHSR